jgi:hypothetical protein
LGCGPATDDNRSLAPLPQGERLEDRRFADARDADDLDHAVLFKQSVGRVYQLSARQSRATNIVFDVGKRVIRRLGKARMRGAKIGPVAKPKTVDLFEIASQRPPVHFAAGGVASESRIRKHRPQVCRAVRLV